MNANVIALGVVSLLTDASSEMVIPLLPLFLSRELGAGPLALGAIEGAANTVSSLLKLVSGRMTDLNGRRKPWILAGYALAALTRPFVAVATAPWQVLAIRLADRTGKGLRSSPRDAVLAGSVLPEQRAYAFGFHQAMDHLGAVIGPALALVALWIWNGDLRMVFALSAIPALLSLAVVAFAVKDIDTPAQPHRPFLTRPSGPVLRILVPVTIFALGNVSETFLLLRVGGTDAAVTTLPLLWMAFHAVKAATSVPLGRWADRVGRRTSILIGWSLFSMIYAGFAFIEHPTLQIALFLTYGLVPAFTDGSEKALVADLSNGKETGTAFGWFNMTTGLIALPASTLFGAIWQWFSPEAAFLTGAAFAAVASVALYALIPRRIPT